jgi:membrane protease YdiL (CAAX protease family)
VIKTVAWMPENESEQKEPIPGENFRLSGWVLLSIIYVVAFAAAEYVTFYVKDFGGMIFYFAILLSLIINSAINRGEAQRKFWLTLGLVPLIRIVSLAMPVAEISEIFWYILIAIPVLAGVFVVARTIKYSVDDIGLNGNRPLFQTLVAASGIVLAIIDYYILKPEALNNQLTLQSTLFPAVILMVATGFTEELAFRGVMQRAAEALSSRGWIYIATVYAVLQIGQGSILHCIFAFGVGLFYGWIVKKTGSILGVACSHGLLNIGLYLILPHLF